MNLNEIARLFRFGGSCSAFDVVSVHKFYFASYKRWLFCS